MNKRRLLGIEVFKEGQIPLCLISQIYEVIHYLKLITVIYEEAELFQHEINELKTNHYRSIDPHNESIIVFRNAKILVF